METEKATVTETEPETETRTETTTSTETEASAERTVAVGGGVVAGCPSVVHPPSTSVAAVRYPSTTFM